MRQRDIIFVRPTACLTSEYNTAVGQLHQTSDAKLRPADWVRLTQTVSMYLVSELAGPRYVSTGGSTDRLFLD